MCKVFAMTNLEKVKVNSKFLNAVKNELTKTGDKDGFGYALLGKTGFLGGERTMRPTKFKNLVDNAGGPKVIDTLPVVLKTHNYFGNLDVKNPKALIAHGRFSTNSVKLENTHPFVNKDVALIHNGVVQDSSKLVKDLSTDCDTEILLKYWERGGMEAIEKNVSGYYAFAILDIYGKLHIARDDRASLYISWSSTIESFIIATTEDIITSLAKKMKWKVEKPGEWVENTYGIFVGNKMVYHKNINPIGKTGFMSHHERMSLGYPTSSYEGWKNYEEVDPKEEKTPAYREEESFYRKLMQEAEMEEAKQGRHSVMDERFEPTREEILNDIPDESILTDEERDELGVEPDGLPNDVVTEMNLYDKTKKYAG